MKNKTLDETLQADLPPFEELTEERYRDLCDKYREIARENFLFKEKIFQRSTERLKQELILTGMNILPGMEELLAGAPPQTSDDEQDPSPPKRKRKPRVKGGRTKIPKEYPRKVVHLYPEGLTKEMIEEDPDLTELAPEVSEQLAMKPIVFYVIQFVRHKVARKTRPERPIAIAPPAPKLVNKGKFDVSVLAWLVIEKYGYHQPLARLEQRFRRMGIHLPRSTLYDQVAAVADAFTPLYDLWIKELLESKFIHTDDTSVRLLLIEGGSRKAHIWVYAGNPLTHPYVIYRYSDTREMVHPHLHLADFSGHLHCDAYRGYDSLFTKEVNRLFELACWSHTRRYFHDAKLIGEPHAWEMLELIGLLFAVERHAKDQGLHGEDRKAYRERFAPGILSDIREWLDTTGTRALPKSKLADGVRYMNNQWQALQTYLTDGDFELTNNYAERLLRTIAIGRKNWMFFAAEKGGVVAAKLFSIIQTCVINQVDPWLYLTDVMNRMLEGPLDLDTMAPHRWKAQFELQAKQRYRQ
jgi:transposase